jgi:hypothetical protein
MMSGAQAEPDPATSLGGRKHVFSIALGVISK